MPTTEEPKPLAPPTSAYTKGFNILRALVLWITLALVLLQFTKEGNGRLEIVFIIFGILDVILAIVLVVVLVQGKHKKSVA